ncbi:cell adhesion molecule CEACAM1-like isoform X2 [Peromyscus maniculatus bairdii]|uniref:cell adhesion molecule CEACAM1-like isoform X2 n=1 Tax=Peromyscus maniculatus bairdii TaxID=230844 RepID=UPI003FD6635E
MELSSAPLHKAQVSWRGLLLTVSLLTYWTSPTAAQDITLEAVPLNVAVGNDVLLLAHNVLDNVSQFSWYKLVSGVRYIIASYSEEKNSVKYERGYKHILKMHLNKSLLIKNVSKDDPGDYGAVVVFKNNTNLLLQVKFHVYHPVTTPSIQVNQTIDKNLTSVFLKCLSIDINISIHWFFKGQSLRITNRMNLTENNSTLQIVPARREDSGDYQCEVSNPLGSKKSDPIQLDIIDPVTTPSIQVNQTIDKNLTSVFLKCLSIDINISIHWFFKGQSLRITNRMNLTENNSTLQIVPARREDSGDYQCEVSNPLGSKKSDPIQLDIIGQSLRITNRMNLTENNSTLQIVPARRVDSGDYQCEVSNPLGSKKSDPIQLDVIDPLNTPFIQVTNKTVKNLISVFLTCLSNGNGISYQWFFKGNILVITNRIRLSENNHTLQIDSVRIEDSGDYQCEVSNEVSSKRSDPIQLDIIRERAKPKHRPSLKGIIGIVAQCLMGLIAVIFVLFLLWRSRRGREPQIENNVKQVDNEPTNLNETSEGSNMKPQKKKKGKK